MVAGSSGACVSLPHACGDVPVHDDESAQIVFPTHVGMFLCKRERACESGSLPHARGDVPDRQLFEQICYESSPRTWGCSCGCFR